MDQQITTGLETCLSVD